MADVERLAERVAAELRRRVQTVHERVECPKCGAPIGWPCWRVNDRALARRSDRRAVKHAHAERLRADGIAER